MHSAAEANMTTAAGIAVEQEGIVESITEESALLKDLTEKSYGQDTGYTVRTMQFLLNRRYMYGKVCQGLKALFRHI